MTTRRVTVRRFEVNIAYAGAPNRDNQALPQGIQAPAKEQFPLGGQTLVNPPAMTYGKIRLAFLCLAQAMTTHDEALTT